MDGVSGAIERYLDELRRRTPRRRRTRLVSEVREHLLDDAARLREQGLDAPAAEERAVERLGGSLVTGGGLARARSSALAVVLVAMCGLATGAGGALALVHASGEQTATPRPANRVVVTWSAEHMRVRSQTAALLVLTNRTLRAVLKSQQAALSTTP